MSHLQLLLQFSLLIDTMPAGLLYQDQRKYYKFLESISFSPWIEVTLLNVSVALSGLIETKCTLVQVVNENIHDCLEHCGAYMSMSVDERAACVDKAGWCPIHLMGTHKFSECNMKVDPRYLCGVDGCAKHHHKSLYGATSHFWLMLWQRLTDMHQLQHQRMSYLQFRPFLLVDRQ